MRAAVQAGLPNFHADVLGRGESQKGFADLGQYKGASAVVRRSTHAGGVNQHDVGQSLLLDIRERNTAICHSEIHCTSYEELPGPSVAFWAARPHHAVDSFFANRLP